MVSMSAASESPTVLNFFPYATFRFGRMSAGVVSKTDLEITIAKYLLVIAEDWIGKLRVEFRNRLGAACTGDHK